MYFKTRNWTKAPPKWKVRYGGWFPSRPRAGGALLKKPSLRPRPSPKPLPPEPQEKCVPREGSAFFISSSCPDTPRSGGRRRAAKREGRPLSPMKSRGTGLDHHHGEWRDDNAKTTPPRKIKTLARKLRLTASHRRELTDHDVAELIVVVGPTGCGGLRPDYRAAAVYGGRIYEGVFPSRERRPFRFWSPPRAAPIPNYEMIKVMAKVSGWPAHRCSRFNSAIRFT